MAQHHRHNLPRVGGKFAVGAADDEGKLVGVAVAGRPIARRLDDGLTLEVLRVCTDGTPNACSFLYARCAKIARLMGYEKVIPYTLAWEGGASLRAVGATPTGPLESHVEQPESAPQESGLVPRAENTAGNCKAQPDLPGGASVLATEVGRAMPFCEDLVKKVPKGPITTR